MSRRPLIVHNPYQTQISGATSAARTQGQDPVVGTTIIVVSDAILKEKILEVIDDHVPDTLCWVRNGRDEDLKKEARWVVNYDSNYEGIHPTRNGLSYNFAIPVTQGDVT